MDIVAEIDAALEECEDGSRRAVLLEMRRLATEGRTVSQQRTPNDYAR